MTAHPDLFEQQVLATPTRQIVGMVRGSDPIESQAAACRVRENQSAIQRSILHILVSEGPHNALDMERRIEFRGLGPSTVRKRISELKQAGLVVQVGRKDRMAVWDVAS